MTEAAFFPHVSYVPYMVYGNQDFFLFGSYPTMAFYLAHFQTGYSFDVNAFFRALTLFSVFFLFIPIFPLNYDFNLKIRIFVLRNLTLRQHLDTGEQPASMAEMRVCAGGELSFWKNMSD